MAAVKLRVFSTPSLWAPTPLPPQVHGFVREVPREPHEANGHSVPRCSRRLRSASHVSAVAHCAWVVGGRRWLPEGRGLMHGCGHAQGLLISALLPPTLLPPQVHGFIRGMPREPHEASGHSVPLGKKRQVSHLHPSMPDGVVRCFLDHKQSAIPPSCAGAAWLGACAAPTAPWSMIELFSAHRRCDLPEFCTGSTASCPLNARRDKAKVFKCGRQAASFDICQQHGRARACEHPTPMPCLLAAIQVPAQWAPAKPIPALPTP